MKYFEFIHAELKFHPSHHHILRTVRTVIIIIIIVSSFYVMFDVFTVAKAHTAVLFVVTPCGLVCKSVRLRRAYWFYYQSRRRQRQNSYILPHLCLPWSKLQGIVSRTAIVSFRIIITITIQVPSRNFRNSSLFTATCTHSPSARWVSAANRMRKLVDIFRKPITSLKQTLRLSVTFLYQIINIFSGFMTFAFVLFPVILFLSCLFSVLFLCIVTGFVFCCWPCNRHVCFMN